MPDIFYRPIGGDNNTPPPAETFYILQENGERILTEDGSFLVQEAAP
jgi:hypothetical protein